MTGSRSRLILSFIVTLLLIATLTANTQTGNGLQSAPGRDKGVVVHEWGTFTSVAGKTGAALEWQPLNGPTDLPEFVFDLNDLKAGKGYRHQENCVKCLEALIRMETPVIYFYSDKEATVTASVSFPQGKITEWYPHARSVYDKGINWGRIQIMPSSMPSANVELPQESAQSHYYAARETDSATIRIGGERGEMQYEKFLFYRGVGNFDLPVSASIKENKVILKSANDESNGLLILFENRGGQVGFTAFDASKREIERPALDGSQEALEGELRKMLTDRGLYEKEARAMIKTWRDSWFEPGLRLFYIVPRAVTDAVLPLRIEPQPTEFVRVLVGRIELITPETAKAVEDQLSSLTDSSADLKEIAANIKRDHGRFAEPILKTILEQTSNARLRARIERVLKLAHDQVE